MVYKRNSVFCNNCSSIIHIWTISFCRTCWRDRCFCYCRICIIYTDITVFQEKGCFQGDLIIMAKLKWLYWGFFYSVWLFLVMYFLIYKKVIANPSAILILWNKDVSWLGRFLSKISHVIVSSLVLGFLLGATTLIKSKNKGV